MGAVYNIPVCPPDRLPLEGETILTKAKVADYKVNANGCWIWQKQLLAGYPLGGKPKDGGTSRMHRVYFERAYGPIPEGHEVHHKCRESRCVNPVHLESVHPRSHDVEHFMRERGFSLDLVRAVREEALKPGASAREVGPRYGVHFTTVIRWWNATSWPDLITEGRVDKPERDCKRCGGPIPTTKNRHAVYCSKRCQIKKDTPVWAEGMSSAAAAKRRREMKAAA